VIQQSGKIVLAGNALSGTSSLDNNEPATFETSMILARHNTNGSRDKSFGPDGDGVARVDFGGLDQGGDVIVSSSGGLVLAGTTNGKFALSGLTRDGRIDASFGANGKVVTDFLADGTTDLVRMATRNRRIVVTGGDRFKTARYFDAGAGILTTTNIDPGSLPQLSDPNNPTPPGPVLLIGTAPSKPASGGRIFSELKI
jgi:hypothetical protein